MRYDNIPGCTYCHPEVASVGLTEKIALEQGYKLKIGKFPFRALGKSMAVGDTDGFVKVIYDAKYGEMLVVTLLVLKPPTSLQKQLLPEIWNPLIRKF